jgi:hypothetical protein
MTAHLGRSLRTIALLTTASAAIGSCGGSSPPRHPLTFVPPGVGASPGAGGAGTPATASTPAGATRGGARAAVGATSSGVSVAGATVTFATPGGESAPTFVASADAICRSFRTRARKIGAGATTLAAQETELGHLVSVTERSIRALTALSPPAGDAAGLRRFATMTVASVVAFAEAQTRTRSTSEALGTQVEARDMRASERAARDAAGAAAAARRLGLHVCGSPGAAWL